MSTFFPFKIERQIEALSNQEHEAKILSLSLFIKRGNRFSCHRYLKVGVSKYTKVPLEKSATSEKTVFCVLIRMSLY